MIRRYDHNQVITICYRGLSKGNNKVNHLWRELTHALEHQESSTDPTFKSYKRHYKYTFIIVEEAPRYT